MAIYPASRSLAPTHFNAAGYTFECLDPQRAGSQTGKHYFKTVGPARRLHAVLGRDGFIDQIIIDFREKPGTVAIPYDRGIGGMEGGGVAGKCA